MNYFQRLLLSIFLCFSLIQCSDNSKPEQTDHIQVLDEIPAHIQEIQNLTIYSGNFNPDHNIELIRLHEYGNDGESNFIQIIKSFEDEKGNLIIWGEDSSRGTGIYIYNADGTYFRQLGRRGKGPGEYGIITNLDVKMGKIFVSDYSSARLNEYSTDEYTIERSIKYETWDIFDNYTFKWYLTPRNDGNYLLVFTEIAPKLGQIEIIYKVVNSEGISVPWKDLVFPSGFAINTKPTSQISKPSVPLRFMGNTAVALSKEDALYAVSTREFLVKKYDDQGRYQSSFYYPIQGAPFDLDEYLKTAGSLVPEARQIRKAFDDMNEEFPKTTPFIKQMIIDDKNRIWVAIFTGTVDDSYQWWILEESGELLAKLLLPRDQPIYDIKNGYLYSKETNGETGDEYVVKYRIELTEK